MIIEKQSFLSDGTVRVELVGFSNETKPTGYADSSLFTENDTNDVYVLVGGEWKKSNAGGGEGGSSPFQIIDFTKHISVEGSPVSVLDWTHIDKGIDSIKRIIIEGTIIYDGSHGEKDYVDVFTPVDVSNGYFFYNESYFDYSDGQKPEQEYMHGGFCLKYEDVVKHSSPASSVNPLLTAVGIANKDNLYGISNLYKPESDKNREALMIRSFKDPEDANYIDSDTEESYILVDADNNLSILYIRDVDNARIIIEYKD